jgi:hypothetical protein
MTQFSRVRYEAPGRIGTAAGVAWALIAFTWTLRRFEMDSQAMLQTAACLFALAALGGLVMAGIRFGAKRNPPVWLTMGHGLLAASALTLLAYATFVLVVPSMAKLALGLFVVAALGGAIMNLNYQWKQRPLPAGLLVVHALVAVTAFALLLASSFGGGTA